MRHFPNSLGPLSLSSIIVGEAHLPWHPRGTQRMVLSFHLCTASGGRTQVFRFDQVGKHLHLPTFPGFPSLVQSKQHGSSMALSCLTDDKELGKEWLETSTGKEVTYTARCLKTAWQMKNSLVLSTQEIGPGNTLGSCPS